MKKVKGVVMRNSGNKVVIVTSEGDFLEVSTPLGQCKAGQMIEVTLPPFPKPLYKRSVLKYAAAAAILILILAIQLLNPLFWPSAAVAYVALDIQSGIELYINKEGKVSEVRAVSEGANSLLEGLELQGRDIYQAVGLILQKVENDGILSKDQNLVMASVVQVDDGELKAVNEEKLRGIIQEEMLGKKVSGYVMVGETDGEVKQQAKKHGMTVNNYLVYDRCRKGGLNIQAEAFLGEDIGKVLAGANTSLNELFPDQCFEFGQHGKVTPEGEKDSAGVHGPNMEQEHVKGSGAEHETDGAGFGYSRRQGMPDASSGDTSLQQVDTSGCGDVSEHSGSKGTVTGTGQRQYGR